MTGSGNDGEARDTNAGISGETFVWCSPYQPWCSERAHSGMALSPRSSSLPVRRSSEDALFQGHSDLSTSV